MLAFYIYQHFFSCSHARRRFKSHTYIPWVRQKCSRYSAHVYNTFLRSCLLFFSVIEWANPYNNFDICVAHHLFIFEEIPRIYQKPLLQQQLVQQGVLIYSGYIVDELLLGCTKAMQAFIYKSSK